MVISTLMFLHWLGSDSHTTCEISRRKATSYSRSGIKIKYKKNISSAISFQQISGKKCESKWTSHERVSNLSFGVQPLTYKINTHNMSGVRS